MGYYIETYTNASLQILQKSLIIKVFEDSGIFWAIHSIVQYPVNKIEKREYSVVSLGTREIKEIARALRDEFRLLVSPSQR
jgi:hypothetical protein